MSPRGCNLKSLASKPASPRKCPVLDSTIFRFVENGPRSWPFFLACWSKPETSRKISDDLFFGVHLNFVKNLRFFLSDDLFFSENTSALCPWPREGPFSEDRSFALDLFCVLGLCLEPCVVDSTSARPHNPKFDAVKLHPTPVVRNSWRPNAHDSYAEDFTDAQPNTGTIEQQQLSFARKIRRNHKNQRGD